MNIAFAAATTKVPQVTLNTSGVDAIMNASPVVQFVLIVLVFLSIMSWAIAYAKYLQLKMAKARNEDFLDRFWKASSLEKLNEEVEDSHVMSGFGRIFRAGYLELQRLADNQGQKDSKFSDLLGSDNFERALRKAVDLEVSNLESRLVFLATTGSTGPFIGLFGTVWGIMSAFRKIGLTGSASLAVVAPGISEALVTTAVGLAAAIPAVIMYNHFINQVKKQEMDLNSFSTDFINIAKRHFFKG